MQLFRAYGKRILLVALLTGMMLVLMRQFQARMFMGQIPLEGYITGLGLVFLAIGLGVGYWVKKRPQVIGVPAPVRVPPPESPLTPRERELLQLLAKGMSNQEMAEQLFVSQNTIKKHLSNIYTKLEVTRRTQAVARAREWGWIG